MVGNQLRQGLMMINNEEIVRELYAGGEYLCFKLYGSQSNFLCHHIHNQ